MTGSGRRARWLIALLAIFAVLAAACGDDDDSSSSDETATETPADDSSDDDGSSDDNSDDDGSGDDSAAAADGDGGGAADGTGYSVGFLFDLFVEDGGWNSTFGRAVEEVQAAYPGLDVQVLEEIGPGTATTNAAEDLAADGVDMVVATYFSQFEMAEVAAAYPDTVFLTWAGFETAANMGHFDAATEDGRYLDGIIAGTTAEEGATIGYVAGFPIEEVNRALNAFTIGVREVNPNATVEVVYINSWYDPPVEQQAADALVNAGAGMLGHELNSPAVATVAEDRGLNVVGYTSDRSEEAPNAWLTSFTFEWGVYFIDQIQALIDGTWEPALTYGGLAQDMIGNSPYGPDVTDEVLAVVDEKRQAIIDGSLDYFAGPLVDNEGNVQVAEGETIPFEERTLCCLWLIDGIDGSVS
ncbi:MAG: BMP family ABC transporter substrate-binding protein [Acidimicrobiales bacterium]